MKSPTSDTLILDSQMIQEWKTGRYDYDRQFARKKEKSKEKEEYTSREDVRLYDAFSRFFRSQGVRESITIVAILLLLGMIFFVAKRKLMYVRSRDEFDIPKEDTIYGVDFARLIAQMEEKGNYYQCIRLCYLQLLRYLHDSRRIHWLPSKTTSLYVREMQMSDFTAVSNIFMKIRYGNYPATRELYEETNRLNEAVREKVEAQKSDANSTALKTEAPVDNKDNRQGKEMES